MANENIGKIVQVIGPVVDVEFDAGHLPEIYHALRIVSGEAGKPGSLDVICEVEQHLGENRVRAVAMKPTDGLQRGMAVVDTGAPISMPVGPATLGRVLNVLGEPVDFPDRPVAAKEPISSSSRASPAAGSVGSLSPGWRSSPTVSRSSSSAASLARWMCPSDSRAFARPALSGSVLSRPVPSR